MTETDYKEFYRRRLHHFQPKGATLFVTCRLAGSLPPIVLHHLVTNHAEREAEIALIEDEATREAELYENQKRYFGEFDRALEQVAFGPTWLAEPAVAKIVYDSICHRNGRVYDLDAFTILSNHVHLVFRPLEGEDGNCPALAAIMMSLKKWTAMDANRILGRTGQFWQHESYDHVVRDEGEWQRIIRYVLENPVKAGLVEDWADWQWTYLRDG